MNKQIFKKLISWKSSAYLNCSNHQIRFFNCTFNKKRNTSHSISQKSNDTYHLLRTTNICLQSKCCLSFTTTSKNNDFSNSNSANSLSSAAFRCSIDNPVNFILDFHYIIIKNVNNIFNVLKATTQL